MLREGEKGGWFTEGRPPPRVLLQESEREDERRKEEEETCEAEGRGDTHTHALDEIGPSELRRERAGRRSGAGKDKSI